MTPNIPCTNPNYGRDDVPMEDSWWWTTHDDIPDEYKCVCFYPLSADGVWADEADFVMPDLGQADLNRIPPELREPLEHLFSMCGKENVVSLAMGRWAEEYGYKPYKEAEQEIDKILTKQIIMDEFSQDYARAYEGCRIS